MSFSLLIVVYFGVAEEKSQFDVEEEMREEKEKKKKRKIRNSSSSLNSNRHSKANHLRATKLEEDVNSRRNIEDRKSTCPVKQRTVFAKLGQHFP